jgi:sec-independent protein translocase protein TatC
MPEHRPTVTQSTSEDASDKIQEFLLKEAYNPYFLEIISKLKSVLVVFLIAAVLGFIFYQKILFFFMGLFHLEGINLVLTSPYQFLDLSIQTAIVTGVTVASPLFFYQLVKFIKPALRPKEYALIIRLLPLAGLLFVLGFAFGVWVIQFLVTLFTETSSQLSISNIWDVSNFFSQLLVTGISLALVFQMPIILTILLRLKIISLQAVKSKRRMVYIGIFIVAALLPPTDILSLLLLAIVPLFLFECALLLNK